jgi:hypothetical protein
VGDRDVHPKAVTSPFPLFLNLRGYGGKKMSKNCDGCKNKIYTEEEKIMNVPYIAHQSAVARQERQMRRMWIVILVLIAALIGTNLAWIIYENSFEDYVITQEVEQDADNGTNNFVGGNVYGETENQNND